MKQFSVEHQRDLFLRLGMNPDEYNPADPVSVRRFANVAVNAQLSGEDARGRALSADDLLLLASITGRG
jgi:hypothetical protein